MWLLVLPFPRGTSPAHHEAPYPGKSARKLAAVCLYHKMHGVALGKVAWQ